MKYINCFASDAMNEWNKVKKNKDGCNKSFSTKDNFPGCNKYVKNAKKDHIRTYQAVRNLNPANSKIDYEICTGQNEGILIIFAYD